MHTSCFLLLTLAYVALGVNLHADFFFPREGNRELLTSTLKCLDDANNSSKSSCQYRFQQQQQQQQQHTVLASRIPAENSAQQVSLRLRLLRAWCDFV